MASSKRPESLPELTDYGSPRVEATTLNPIPQNIPDRLSDLLSHLPKLNVIDSICCPLETFTLFPNLPKELRLKIWNYATRQSRTLLLSGTWYLERTNLDKLQNESIENNNKVPAVLHTCSEARQEGLKHYTACAKRCSHDLSSRYSPSHRCEKQDCVNKQVYINFYADRFLCRYFHDGAFLHEYQLDEEDLAMIQFLDIESEDPWGGLCRHHLMRFLLGERLKELNIVVKEDPWLDTLLPNTIDKELNIKEYEKELMDDIELRRQIS
jgi:hypothetical protein